MPSSTAWPPWGWATWPRCPAPPRSGRPAPERQVKKAYLAPFHDSYHFAADYAVMEPHRTWTTYQGPDNAEKFLENSYHYPADLRTSPVQASFMWLDMATGKTTHVEHTFHPDGTGREIARSATKPRPSVKSPSRHGLAPGSPYPKTMQRPVNNSSGIAARVARGNPPPPS